VNYLFPRGEVNENENGNLVVRRILRKGSRMKQITLKNMNGKVNRINPKYI